MKQISFILVFLFSLFGLSYTVDSEKNCFDDFPKSNATLSRKKRYLAFPTGTNFVTTMTLLKAIQLKEPKNWNLDLEFDMIWPIPNQEKIFKRPKKKYFNPYHHLRRHKRDLYKNIELALSNQGLPGTLCLLRTICEAKYFLNTSGISLLEDALKIILSHEDSGRKLDKYDVAYRKDDCKLDYPCPVSILEFLLHPDTAFFV